jgi:hypothetical protein
MIAFIQVLYIAGSVLFAVGSFLGLGRTLGWW